ncbi:MAG: DUF4123 domain-containing protein [Pseudomonas sp.]|uniref:DUF4123 domain-containing protein n=1 Tax=Pseudomonas sp. TaxID=306 RepID=UPI003D6DAD0D
MIAMHRPDSSPQWLLLDRSGAPPVGVTLQHTLAHALQFSLFEETEWHALREQGPVLVDLRTCPVLADACQRDVHHWRGLLLTGEASTATLLAHLRRMLTVSCGLHHRALLSFYNPQTASYFFDACDAGELSRWLGPIDQLRWFGGTWADRAIGSQGWQQLFNPGLSVRPLAQEENLSLRQRENLQTCLLEHHAWQWAQATGSDYSRLWSHLQEGLALGFSERAVLDGWLWLRLQYRAAVPELPLVGRTQQERLDNLRQRWQNDIPRT